MSQQPKILGHRNGNSDAPYKRYKINCASSGAPFSMPIMAIAFISHPSAMKRYLFTFLVDMGGIELTIFCIPCRAEIKKGRQHADTVVENERQQT